MIRKVSLIVFSVFIFGCTSSSKESSNQEQNETLIPLEKDIDGANIPAEIRSNITSKRRGKLKRLQADGRAWFSFELRNSFEELMIIITSNEGSTEFIWPLEDITEEDASSEGFQKINVDVLLVENVSVFFDENIRFTFQDDLTSSNNTIEVYLDGELQDIPGILYDIGL